MATEANKFNWRTRAKISSLDITGKQVHTLADHETDHNAHPGLARKGDGTLVDPKVSQAIASHRGDSMAHILHNARRSEVIGGDECTEAQAIAQYEAAKNLNYNTTTNATATSPVPHIITAWVLAKVLLAETTVNIEKWWANLIKNVAVTVKQLWTFDGGIKASTATVTDVKEANALCTDINGKIIRKTVDTTVTKGSDNLITSGGVEKAIGESAKSHTHGQIANNGDVTMRETPKDADPTNVKWVRDTISTWWTNTCNAAIAFKSTLDVTGLIKALAGIEAKSVKITDIKDAKALCTDADGNVAAKTVDTAVTKDSSNLITSGGVAEAIAEAGKHTHGQIANDGSVTMKDNPGDNDPTNTKWVIDQIQSGGGSNFKDYVLDISESVAGAVIDFNVGTDTNLNVGMYDILLRVTFGTGTNTITADIPDPTAEVSSATMAEDVPVYVPGKSLLIIHKDGLKFRVPKSWMNFYGPFQIGDQYVTMDPSDPSTTILKISSYKVVARRIYPKY